MVAEALSNRSWVRQVSGGLPVASMAEGAYASGMPSRTYTSPTPRINSFGVGLQMASSQTYQALHLGYHPILGCRMLIDLGNMGAIESQVVPLVHQKQATLNCGPELRHDLDAH